MATANPLYYELFLGVLWLVASATILRCFVEVLWWFWGPLSTGKDTKPTRSLTWLNNSTFCVLCFTGYRKMNSDKLLYSYTRFAATRYVVTFLRSMYDGLRQFWSWVKVKLEHSIFDGGYSWLTTTSNTEIVRPVNLFYTSTVQCCSKLLPGTV